MEVNEPLKRISLSMRSAEGSPGKPADRSAAKPIGKPVEKGESKKPETQKSELKSNYPQPNAPTLEDLQAKFKKRR